MPYIPPIARDLLSPETLSRKVLFAVEVFDPVAQSLVSRGLTVTAQGLDNAPIVSWSGRFVWLEEGGKWPTRVSIVPYRLPFMAQTVTPPVPADLTNIKFSERLVRITLRPTPAYNLSEDVTAIRGSMHETAADGSAAVTDAHIELAWRDHDGNWQPTPPPTAPDTTTDANGEFAAFVRLDPAAGQLPDVVSGLLMVRLQVTRGSTTRVTPDDFPFLADPANKGRIVEGQLLMRDLRLSWADLPAF